MTRHYITFSGAKYFDTTKRIVEDAPQFGADVVSVFDDHWLVNQRPEFIDRMRWFFEHPKTRGFGWFTWKPFVILDAFRRINDGDVLLYTDADTYPIADLGVLYETCVRDGGCMLFNARGCVNFAWTKRDIFTVMGCDEPAYHMTWQAVARFLVFQKGGSFPVEKFLGEWLGFTANPLVNTFDPSVLGLPDYPGFIENRCEQSVLTNLSVKYGRQLYREACGFGDGGPENIDLYPHALFRQVGAHSFRPDFSGNESEGSSFRNVNT